MEESGLTDRIYSTSSSLVDKGFEYGAVAYLKTYDKLQEFKGFSSSFLNKMFRPNNEWFQSFIILVV